MNDSTKLWMGFDVCVSVGLSLCSTCSPQQELIVSVHLKMDPEQFETINYRKDKEKRVAK